MQLRYSIVFTAVAASTSAWGADVGIKVEIPRLTVAEYKRPYVAMWIEKASDQSFIANLAVWYDLKKRDNGGTKWLKDVRQWWRKSGRDVQMPMDGVSGATRAPGEQSLSFNGAKAPLAALPPGDYAVVVEAAREDGGREVQRVPFHWPAKTAQTLKVQGEHELGAITLDVKP